MTNSEPILISIGIPAYNEESNIAELLRSLLTQIEQGFKIAEILVVSDKSTDNTVAEARTVVDKRIIVTENDTRQGKVVICNTLFKKFSGDYFLQLDADISFEDALFLARLVACAREKQADIVCPCFEPLPPRTYAERIAYFGIQWWNEILKDPLVTKTMIHRCIGRGRLFSRKLLSEFVFPEDIGSSEDVYAFFWAKTNGYVLEYVPGSVARYRLPSTFADYIKQMRRFLDTSAAMERYFGPELYWSENQVTSSLKFKYLFRLLKTSNPTVSLAYIALQAYAHATAGLVKQKTTWDIVASTKVLK